MRHDDPQLIDVLAAEYALGTLRGPARKRFERWRLRSLLVERRVNVWEDRFVHLALALPPVAPSPKTWQGIERRIAASSRPARQPAQWRALAAAVALFAIVAAGLAVWQSGLFGSMEPFATIAATNGAPLWRVDVTNDYSRLRVVAVSTSEAHPGKSLELWALPAGGKPPVSLGLMPETGRLERRLTPSQQEALRAAGNVAVSLEPLGGSPTGAPTGPVLFVAEPHAARA